MAAFFALKNRTFIPSTYAVCPLTERLHVPAACELNRCCVVYVRSRRLLVLHDGGYVPDTELLVGPIRWLLQKDELAHGRKECQAARHCVAAPGIIAVTYTRVPPRSGVSTCLSARVAPLNIF